jgi:thymidylate synthase
LYFQRLIQNGPSAHPNQLDYVIELYSKNASFRRSALQVAVYDAKKDMTGSALRGFPCLQHVTFAPVDGKLNVNAFYATQYAFERAYGNYLGLCRLGRFVAHEMKLPMGRMTCLTGLMLRDTMPASMRASLNAAVDLALGPKEESP